MSIVAITLNNDIRDIVVVLFNTKMFGVSAAWLLPYCKSYFMTIAEVFDLEN